MSFILIFFLALYYGGRFHDGKDIKMARDDLPKGIKSGIQNPPLFRIRERIYFLVILHVRLVLDSNLFHHVLKIYQ